MGRKPEVTFEMVVAAAEAMNAEKLAVTMRTVRERLGNVGSYGTINKLLGAWRARQEQHVTSVLTLPLVAQKSILDYMSNELATVRQTLESNIAHMQSEMSDLATENEKQFDLLEENVEFIDGLRAEIATHQGRSTQLATDLNATRDELVRERVGAESARTELAKALLRLEAMPRLEADLNAVRVALDVEKLASRAALDAEHAARVTAEQAAAVAAAKIESSSQRVQEFIDRLAKAEAINTKAQEKIDAAAKDAVNLNAINQAIQARLEAAARELDDVKKSATEAKAASKKSGEEAAELRGTITQMKADVKKTEKKSD
jgi:colicin import membrane protein